jgi:hypothetical protein
VEKSLIRFATAAAVGLRQCNQTGIAEVSARFPAVMSFTSELC